MAADDSSIKNYTGGGRWQLHQELYWWWQMTAPSRTKLVVADDNSIKNYTGGGRWQLLQELYWWWQMTAPPRTILVVADDSFIKNYTGGGRWYLHQELYWWWQMIAPSRTILVVADGSYIKNYTGGGRWQLHQELYWWWQMTAPSRTILVVAGASRWELIMSCKHVRRSFFEPRQRLPPSESAERHDWFSCGKNYSRFSSHVWQLMYSREKSCKSFWREATCCFPLLTLLGEEILNTFSLFRWMAS